MAKKWASSGIDEEQGVPGGFCFVLIVIWAEFGKKKERDSREEVAKVDGNKGPSTPVHPRISRAGSQGSRCGAVDPQQGRLYAAFPRRCFQLGNRSASRGKKTSLT